MKPLERIESEIMAGDKPRSLLLGIFAAIALLLSVAGIYGAISYSVAERTGEIGIRAALGASRGNLPGLTLRRGMWTIAAWLRFDALHWRADMNERMADTIPLAPAADGVLLVSGTRIPLDTLVTAFRDGATPEEIAQQYPSLPLGDICEVIRYALRHPEELNSYFEKRAQSAAKVRATNELHSNPDGIRERLLARRTER